MQTGSRGLPRRDGGLLEEGPPGFIRSGLSGRLSKQGSLNRHLKREECALHGLRHREGGREPWVMREGGRLD